MRVRIRHFSVGIGIVAAAVAISVPVSAVVVTPPPVAGRAGSNTEMVMSGTGPGQGVNGFIADPGNPFDPLTGYPPSNPASGFTPKSEGFAGVILGVPSEPGPPLNLYCIDINTSTWGGIGYELGDWTTSGVPNVGYVARLLNNNFPTVPASPPGLASDNQRAAATQAAIWYFSDRFVLDTADPLHNAVATLVAATIAAGPLVQPPPPSLTITPSVVGGPTNTAVGPFSVTSSAPITVTAVGGSMFADAAATTPVPNGTAVASGTSLWLTSSGGTSAVLAATSVATVPSGNVYLYDGNTGGVNDAQRLILSQPATLRTTVAARANFVAPGSLVVTKTISGPAAGQQGAITIAATCDGTVLQPLFVIPAGTPPGTVSHTYTNVPGFSTCTVVEQITGSTSTVTVLRAASGQVVVVPPGGSVTAPITDIYDSGSLVVSKTITGLAAGQQGAVTITVNCGGTQLADFNIPAGTPAGTVSQTYGNIIAGTVCTATETANGSSASVLVTAQGSPQQLTIGANGSGSADLTDTYELAPGSLVVTKNIGGAGAGQQDVIALLVSCGGSGVFQFIIPAATPAGPVSRSFTNIPGGATCIVTEVLTGASTLVSVVTSGNPQQVTVPAAGTANVAITNSFDLVPVPPDVLPVQPTLPGTGAPGDWMYVTGVAIGMFVLGATLVYVSRRRPARP